MPAVTELADRRDPVARWWFRVGVAVAMGVAVLLAVGLSCGLLTGHPIGAADNGDGARLYCGAGLAPATPSGRANWQGGVVLTFDRVPPCADPIPSSAGVLLRVAAYGGIGPWSLTRLGWLYTLLAAGVGGLAAWAASRAGPLRVLALVPALAPLADPSFTRFFLSAYSEPAGLLGCVTVLCGAAVVCVTERAHRAERTIAILLLAGGGVLAATAKTAYLPVLAVAAVVCALTAVPVRRGERHRYDRVGPLAVAVLAVVVVAGPTSAALSWQDRHYPGVNAYDLIYTTVLPGVPDATTALGLPEAAADHAGEAFYPGPVTSVPGAGVVATAPGPEQRLAWQVLATHPAAALHALGIALQATRGDELTYLPGRPWTPQTSAVSLGQVVGEQGANGPSLRAWLDGMRLPWLSSALVLLGVLVGAAGLWRRRAAWSWFARIAGLAAVSAVPLAALAVAGDGYFEIAKHVWPAAYLVDVSALALLGALVSAIAERLRRPSRPASEAGRLTAELDLTGEPVN
jgi:hypothetical protein